MKRTIREDFRVRAVIAAEAPQALGLQVDGHIVSGRVEVVIEPKRLGDFGLGVMSDSLVSRDILGDYQRRAEQMARELRWQDQVVSAEVEFTERAECTHCRYAWEELTAEALVRHPDLREEPGDGPGLPLCCAEAQAEWRAANPNKGTPLGFKTADRRELLLSLILRERGEWTPGRVKRVYGSWQLGHVYRSAIRRDLAALHTAGHLTLHDDLGRRFFTVKGGAR